MFFSIASENKSCALLKAYRFINLYKTSTNEIVLNEYCIKKYKKSLKQICHMLLLGAKFSRQGNNLIVTFKDKSDDDLASLITYGNSEIQGSNILKYAFERK